MRVIDVASASAALKDLFKGYLDSGQMSLDPVDVSADVQRVLASVPVIAEDDLDENL